MPPRRVTSYCSGVSSWRHCSSLFTTFVAIASNLLSSLRSRVRRLPYEPVTSRRSQKGCKQAPSSSDRRSSSALAACAGRRSRPRAPRVASPSTPDEVAPVEACPNQTGLGPLGRRTGRRDALHDQLRPLGQRARAAGAVEASSAHAAEQKSTDIVGCDEFSHEACGRPFTFWDQKLRLPEGLLESGREHRLGDRHATPPCGSIVTAWLESPEHHENILGPYREIGIGAAGRRPRRRRRRRGLDPGLRQPQVLSALDACASRTADGAASVGRA